MPPPAPGGQLEVDVLEARRRDAQVVQPLAARERRAGELVQQRASGPRSRARAASRRRRARRRGSAASAAPSSPGAPSARIAPVLDDRDAVGERLRLVEVVRRQQHGLAERLERADRLPRLAPRRGVEAGRRLVEEDQLGVADEREREVEPPLLAAGERCACARRPTPRARPARSSRRRRAARVEPGPVADGLAHGQVAVQPAGLQHDPDPLAQRARPRRRGPCPSTATRPPVRSR